MFGNNDLDARVTKLENFCYYSGGREANITKIVEDLIVAGRLKLNCDAPKIEVNINRHGHPIDEICDEVNEICRKFPKFNLTIRIVY